MIFWIIAGLFFGKWASREVSSILKEIYYSGYNYDWLESLYLYLLGDGIFGIILLGSPFFIVGIYAGTMAETSRRAGTL